MKATPSAAQSLSSFLTFGHIEAGFDPGIGGGEPDGVWMGGNDVERAVGMTGGVDGAIAGGTLSKPHSPVVFIS